MGSRISNLVNDIESTYLRLKTLYQEINEASRNGKYGKVQQLIHTRRYLYKKLLALKCKFSLILKGDICNITYEYMALDSSSITTGKAFLVNVTDEEICDILKLYCKFNSHTFIRILEIQRIPTKFC